MSRVDDLSRLREEMQAGQRDRTQFVTNLTHTVADLRKANQAANKERRRNVLETLAANEARRKQEAEPLGKARAEFVTNLKQTVAGSRKENMATNAAAHAAWYGAKAGEAVSARRGGKWFRQPAE